MRGFDVKSGLIGGLSVALVAVVLGAGQQASPAAPRYQITTMGNSLLVLDNETGAMNVLALSHRDQAWKADEHFSVDDAVSKSEGARIMVGPGR